jgi:hypothetical protein
MTPLFQAYFSGEKTDSVFTDMAAQTKAILAK